MSKLIEMALSQAEIKLILRLRQLKNQKETSLFLVTTSPLSISVMGQIELLETAVTSGSSAIMYY